MSAWVKKHPLLAYFILAYAISWGVELPLIAVQQGWTDLPIPFAIHYLVAYGPMVASILVTWLSAGSDGLKELCGRVTKWRVGLRWILFAVLSPVAAFALAVPIVRLVSGTWPDLRLLGQVNYMPYLGLGAPLLWLATLGLGEEIGWRGFALPRLQKTRTASSATLVLGLLWALWHVPAFFYLDTLEELGLIVLPGFMFGVLCGAVVYTWLYNSTGGSVLVVALWHASFDFFTASRAGRGIIPIVMTAAVIVLAFVIARRLGPENFSRLERHAL